MENEDMKTMFMSLASKNRNRVKAEHTHPCCIDEVATTKVWRGTDGIIRQGHFGPSTGSTSGQYIDEEIIKEYTCPRGHTFKSKSPIVVAVDEDPDYNTGPICGYCYVDWFKANVNANEVLENT